MTAVRVALGVFVLVVAASIGVGAATSPAPTAAAGTPGNGTAAPPMGANVTAFMQATTAQAGGTVGNGMWAAAFAAAPNDSAKRQLVESRIDALDRSLADLQAERRTVQAAYRNGSINRTTYRARLSAVVGQLAAFDDGVEQASVRGQAVGVNETRLETLRTRARDLSGEEVSALARSLTGAPPGRSGLFADGAGGETGPPADATNRTNGPGPTGDDGPGQGPPVDPGRPDGEPAETSTPTPTATDAEDD